MLVTSGGASVGEHDLVQTALDRRAAWQLDFWKIAMRPGKPLMFGTLGPTERAGPARQSGLDHRHRDSCS